MARVDDFDAFYSSTAAGTLIVTYALSGDRDATRNAVEIAYRRAWRDWAKISDHDPLEYVRDSAARSVSLQEHTHPIRHRHQSVDDTELFAALDRLDLDSRRLIVLMTLARVDLEAASREVGVGVEEAIERATSALDELESLLGLDLNRLERRLTDLASAKLGITLPPARVIRDAATRGHRVATAGLLALALAVIFGGGAIATTGGALTHLGVPDRQRLGAEATDAVLDAATIDTDNLLTEHEIASLDPANRWRTTSTDDDPRNDTPYATCPTGRYATADPVKVFVRTHEAKDTVRERVAQAIEVAPTKSAAETAFKHAVAWFADCQHPRVQLLSSYAAQNTVVLRLVSHRSPVRTFTVGISRTGAVTTTLVHEIDGTTAPDIAEFASVLHEGVARLCDRSGGSCAGTGPAGVQPTLPPPTTEAPSFLGIVDLPPVADVDHVWAGVDSGNQDPARTLCNEPTPSEQSRSSRLYVIPEAGLPEAFGIAETVAAMADANAANTFAAATVQALARCERANLTATVSSPTRFAGDGYAGYTWSVHFQINKQATITYLTSVLVSGNVVARLTFTPAGNLNLDGAQFGALVERAGQRLRYAQP